MTSNSEQGPMQDRMTYDATEEEDGGSWSALRWIALLVVVAAFGGFVWLAYMQGVRNGSMGTPPIVATNEAPYKVAPADPGGRTFENTDKTIYDRVDGEGGAGTEQLAAAPEQPVEIDVAETDSASGFDLVSEAKVAEAPVVPLPRPDGITAAIDAAEADLARGGPPYSADVQPREEEVEIASASPAPVTTPASPTDSSAPAAASGGFFVQIAAFTDMPSAEGAWKTLQAKHGEVIAGHDVDYQVADVKGTTYYRVRLASFASKAEAESVCKALSARGQTCLVKSS